MTEEKNLLLQTKYFGQVECPEERLLRFDKGLFGFEEEKVFPSPSCPATPPS